jgi:hypothetical protein
LKSGLLGAATAGISAGVLHGIRNPFVRVGGHAVLGGSASVASGGRFGPGALASGLTVGLNLGGISGNPYFNVAASTGLGGAISKATGGDFATGAINAGFQVAFNDLRDTWLDRNSQKEILLQGRALHARIVEAQVNYDGTPIPITTGELYSQYMALTPSSSAGYLTAGEGDSIFFIRGAGDKAVKVGNLKYLIDGARIEYGGNINYLKQGVNTALNGHSLLRMNAQVAGWNYAQALGDFWSNIVPRKNYALKSPMGNLGQISEGMNYAQVGYTWADAILE